MSTLFCTHYYHHFTTNQSRIAHINQVRYYDQSLTTHIATSSSTTSTSALALLGDILLWLSSPLFTTSRTSRSQFDAHACTMGGGVATLLTRVQLDGANVGLATSLQAPTYYTIIYNLIATHDSLSSSTTTGN
eukprot:5465459-Amphidinium_carterae.1